MAQRITVASLSAEVEELKATVAESIQAQRDLLAALIGNVQVQAQEAAAPVEAKTAKVIRPKTEKVTYTKGNRKVELGKDAEFEAVRIEKASGKVLKHYMFFRDESDLADFLGTGADCLKG